jgi:hypothetical protein
MVINPTNLALLFMGLVTGITFWQWDNIREWADGDDFLCMMIAIGIIVIALMVSFAIAETR